MAEAVAKTTIKPYKLKPSSDKLSRDDLATWKQVLLSHMRQNAAWRPFLPPSGAHREWKAADSGEDQHQELVLEDFHDFLTCLATFSPQGFSETVQRESTSFNWVINLINDTFGLKTRGEHFLGIEDIKFDFSGGETYQMAYMKIKDFVCNGMLSQGDRFEGNPLAVRETLTPVAKNFITKEWLSKIDPRLPKHIRDTRGHLFTQDKPTLACNQKVICDQLPTLLAELEGKSDTDTDTVSVNTGHVPAGMGYVPAGRRGGGGRPRGLGGRGLIRGAGALRGYAYQPRALHPPARPQYMTGCKRCLEAIPARYDAARTHNTRDCPWPANNNIAAAPRANFRVVLVPEAQDQPPDSDSYYENSVFESTFYPASVEDVTEYANFDNKESEYYPESFQSLSGSENDVRIQAMPIRRVQTISVKINDNLDQILTIDSGAEANCIKLDMCKKLNLKVNPLDNDDVSKPTQADGQSMLEIVGQTKFCAVKGNVTFHFSGYVARTLGADILCGGPFIESNKIVQELHKRRIVVDGKYTFQENSLFRPDKPSISRVEISNEEVLKLVNIGSSVPKHIKEQLNSIHVTNKHVFDGDLTGGYNGTAGNFDVDFNFKGGIPPTPNIDSCPSYFTSQDKELLQAKINELESKGICVRVSDTNIVPKYAAPCMLVKKHSVRDLKPGEYERMSIQEKLKYNRFILCHNKLSEHIEKLPSKLNKLDDTVRVVGSHEFVITSDLSDSFWQRHIAEEKLPYLAFHSPYKGLYLFLRSTQGLINQSEGLEEMVSVILADCIMSGWCRVLADNIYVMGHSFQEAVNHWRIVLELLKRNNIKLSAKKTACFPEKLDLLGWTKQGKYLVPDLHRQNVIANAPLPNTVKALRSYLGAFRTFFRCKKQMSSILKDLEELQAGKKSSDKVTWTENLKQTFEDSKKEILKLDQLYLPKPDDQLVMTSDWSEKGISCTLWAIIDNTPQVVSRFSSKLEKSMENMLLKKSQIQPKTLPCDGEMTAVYVGIKSPIISANIRASNKKTVCLVDSKPVVEAARLIKDGKFSSSRIINNLMTALSDYDIEFQHLSSKMGQNLIDDYGSRNPASCNDNPECKICNFIKDCQQLTIAPLSFSISDNDNCVLGHVSRSDNFVQEIIRGEKSIPFNNRKALKYLQDNDPDLIQLREYLITGKRPTPKNTKVNSVKRYLNLHKDSKLTIAKDGCIVVTKRDNNLVNRELIVLPDEIGFGIIYAMHLNLSHPTFHQLSKILDTKFFVLKKDAKIREIIDSCALCKSVSKIPREIENFKANEMPDHPGQAFTVDILKMNRKNIMVTVDNFSGFVSTMFIQSEKAEDLLEGIILTTSPLRTSLTTNIRVDQAPGFMKLFRSKSVLTDLNISLEPGEAKNKNSLALADKKMKELEDEIRKLSNNKGVNVRILAKATTVVNEKIRHQGLSAKEIMFSRDQFSQENLSLNDETIATQKMELRKDKNIDSAKSKAQVQRPAAPANASKGQLVFLKHEISKHSRREMYIVLDTDNSTQSMVIAKLPHTLSHNEPVTFQPHNFKYIVKQTDVVLSPNQPSFSQPIDKFEVKIEHSIEEFEDEYEEEVFSETLANSPLYFPYDEDSDEEYDCDLEYEIEDSVDSEDANNVVDDENNNSTDETDSFYSNEEENETNYDATGELSSDATNDESTLEENIHAREHEISDLIDEPSDPAIDQSRQPKKGDIVKFILNDEWVVGKILYKPKTTYNYNVELQNGEKLYVSLLPPTAEQHYGWTLLQQDDWKPEEFRQNDQIRSLEPSFIDVDLEFPPEELHYTLPAPQLNLTPDDDIQHGQVYNIPEIEATEDNENVQLSTQVGIFKISKREYDIRHQKVLQNLALDFPAHQITPSLIKLYICDQLYVEHQRNQSTSGKIMNFIKKFRK